MYAHRKFRVWSQTKKVGKHQYLTVVAAIPQAPHPTGQGIETESKLYASSAEARSADARMVESMRFRVERRGDIVVPDVETRVVFGAPPLNLS